MAQACDIISSQTSGARFLVFTVPHVSKTYYNEILSQSKPSRCLIELIQDEVFEWRSQLDMAISASGMETLENALLGIPMVIMYKTNWITYFIAKMMINIPYLGMPNLLAGREIVPEFMQMKATPENLAQPLLNWIQNPSLRQQLRGDLLKLRDQFGGNGASDRAARVILEEVA
jgi:lipid-A-disaccharide synthase